MRTVSATSLVGSALRLLGVYAVGETPAAEDISTGTQVLNDLIDDWATQDLTIPTATREVFPLVIGQQTYTIGAGGNFDTTRPQAIDAASIRVNPASVITLTSITRSGTTATATKAGHGYVTGMNITIAGAVQTAYNGTVIITVTSSSTFTYPVVGSPATPATGTKTAQDAIGQAYEIPVDRISYENYIAIVVKGLTTPYPVVLYYAATFEGGLAQIFVWPIPSAAYELVLYFGSILSQFDETAPFTNVVLPPAYARALRFNLATELLPEYPRPDVATVARIERIATDSLANLKRLNNTPAVLDSGVLGALFGGDDGQFGSPWDFFTR